MQLTTIAHLVEAEQRRRRAFELRVLDEDEADNPTPFLSTWIVEALHSDIGGKDAIGERCDIKYGQHLAYLQTWMHEASCFSSHYAGQAVPKQIFDRLHPGSVDEESMKVEAERCALTRRELLVTVRVTIRYGCRYGCSLAVANDC